MHNTVSLFIHSEGQGLSILGFPTLDMKSIIPKTPCFFPMTNFVSFCAWEHFQGLEHKDVLYML